MHRIRCNLSGMDYRYYYELTEPVRAERKCRVGIRTVLAAGLAVEAASAAAPSLDTPAIAVACITAALTALFLRQPLGRIFERAGSALRPAGASPAF